MEFRKGTISIDEYNSHADILLLKHELKLYVDVSVVRSTAPSKIAKGRTDVPLAAASYRARDKHRKYDRICEVNGYANMPFVLESNGALSREAVKLLRVLSAHSVDMSAKQWLTHAYKVISVVLQSANARLAQGGMHMQTINTTMWQRQRNSQQRWLQSRGHAPAIASGAPVMVPSSVSHPHRRASAVCPASPTDSCRSGSSRSELADSDSTPSSDEDESPVLAGAVSRTLTASPVLLTQPLSDGDESDLPPTQPDSADQPQLAAEQCRRRLTVSVCRRQPTDSLAAACYMSDCGVTSATGRASAHAVLRSAAAP
jgi:hypothetical protein